MFERFLSEFTAEPLAGSVAAPRLPAGLGSSGFAELVSRFAGATFNDGLYRLHDVDSASRANELTAEGFPDFADKGALFWV